MAGSSVPYQGTTRAFAGLTNYFSPMITRKRPKRAHSAMRMLGAALAILILETHASDARTLMFAGRSWTVRPTGAGSPGPRNYPNHWCEENAWVDSSGQLHLKIEKRDGQWCCAEVWSDDLLGFGRYEWYVIGRIDRLDKNIVLGLFPYLGPSGRNEIDIETAAWGKANGNRENFTVWPAKGGLSKTSRRFPFSLTGGYTTHRLIWQKTSVLFQMLHGHRTGNDNEIARWEYKPSRYLDKIPGAAMSTHMNLWLFRGSSPSDGKEAEVIIRAFRFDKQREGLAEK